MSAPAPTLWPIIAVLFGLALTGIASGIRLAEIPAIARRIVPFSGGVLVGIAGFWVLPEIAVHFGWAAGLGGVLAGFALLWTINRFLYPVCPGCSHNHDHSDCEQRLHGFAAPLLAAASVHSFFDGWSLAVAQEQTSEELRLAFLIGISIHKVPEGLALGVLLLAAVGSAWRAALYAAAVQCWMFAGALTALLLQRHLAAQSASGLLAVAAGIFVYLGYHAVEEHWRDRGIARTLGPALTGAVGAAAMRFLPGI